MNRKLGSFAMLLEGTENHSEKFIKGNAHITIEKLEKLIEGASYHFYEYTYQPVFGDYGYSESYVEDFNNTHYMFEMLDNEIYNIKHNNSTGVLFEVNKEKINKYRTYHYVYTITCKMTAGEAITNPAFKEVFTKLIRGYMDDEYHHIDKDYYPYADVYLNDVDKLAKILKIELREEHIPNISITLEISASEPDEDGFEDPQYQKGGLDLKQLDNIVSRIVGRFYVEPPYSRKEMYYSDDDDSDSDDDEYGREDGDRLWGEDKDRYKPFTDYIDYGNGRRDYGINYDYDDSDSGQY